MIDRVPQIRHAEIADIDPRTAFASPQEIEQAEGLSAADKQLLLARWAELARNEAASDPKVVDEAEAAQSDLARSTGRPQEGDE